MGLLSRVFGNDKDREKLIDGAIGGIDKIFYTKQEKAAHRIKAADWWLRYLEASQPQNLARRLIAMIIVGVWAFLIVVTGLVWYFNKEWAEFLLLLLGDLVAQPFMLIIGFYFLKHAVSAFVKGKGSKT